MKDKAKSLLAKLRQGQTWALIGAVAAMAVLYWFFGCPIKYFTGLSCPGCGMTRAALEAATLHPGAALHYHPLLPVVPVGAWLALSKTAAARPKLRSAGLGLLAAVFIAVWLVRLLGDDPVVNWSTPGFWQDIRTGYARLRFWE